jgi:hypothetical protein
MNTPDQNDELRRRSDEGWAFKERRDEFFRCGGYDSTDTPAPSAAFIELDRKITAIFQKFKESQQSKS